MMCRCGMNLMWNVVVLAVFIAGGATCSMAGAAVFAGADWFAAGAAFMVTAGQYRFWRTCRSARRRYIDEGIEQMEREL